MVFFFFFLFSCLFREGGGDGALGEVLGDVYIGRVIVDSEGFCLMRVLSERTIKEDLRCPSRVWIQYMLT